MLGSTPGLGVLVEPELETSERGLEVGKLGCLVSKMEAMLAGGLIWKYTSEV